MTKFQYTAADEIDRRASNRALVAEGHPKVPGPDTAEGARLLSMSGPELRAEAEGTAAKPARKPAKAPAKAARKPAAAKPAKPAKPARTPLQIVHTMRREEAYAWRLAEYHAGRKHTVAAAYARFGTAHASVTNAPGFTGI